MLTSLLKFSMTHGVSENLGGVFPNKVDATLEFRANYDDYKMNYGILFPWIAFSQGCRERISGDV